MAEKMLNSFDIQDSIADDDIVLGYDKSENKVKNFKFGTGIWDWIVDKMANAVVSKLTTTDKTVLGAINELNSKAQIDTSAIYYQDSEYNALGGVDACVKDAVTKNRFPKDGTFFKNFTAGSRYLAVGYRYSNGAYGLIILYKYGTKLDYRYSIVKGNFSKIS